MKTLLCRCVHAGVLEPAAVEAIRAEGDCLEVDDLCARCAAKDPAVPATVEKADRIAACHPRAVRGLLTMAGVVVRDGTQLVDLRRAEAKDAAAPPLPVPQSAAAGSGAWFPVIDLERCTHCMECLSFCLFGVYAVENKRLTVVAPENCKPGCPACARVCPQMAIVFPKFAGGGPIAGAPVTEQAAQHASMTVDVSAMLGGDVYAALKARGAQRFGADAQALAERRRWLAARAMARHQGKPSGPNPGGEP